MLRADRDRFHWCANGIELIGRVVPKDDQHRQDNDAEIDVFDCAKDAADGVKHRTNHLEGRRSWFLRRRSCAHRLRFRCLGL